MKILTADDSEFMRAMLKNIVAGAWPEAIVSEATTGQETIDRCKQERPDILLLDIMMPEKTGLDVLKEIDKTIPVIVISAADQENLIQQATTLGARAFIAKPFDPQNVVQTIKEVVGNAPAGQ